MLRAVSFVTPALATWVRVPGGLWVHNTCVHEVANGEVADFPDCPYESYSADEHEPNGDIMQRVPLSPKVQCYAQMAVSTSVSEFTQMNASFVVPPLPRSHSGQTVYLWPGFKAIEPVMYKPVLQPVLQYYGSGGWQLQSWGVGIPAGTMTGPAIDVSPGDLLTSYMELSGNTWTVYGQNTRTGQESVLRLSKSQACNGCLYTNAVFVNENVMGRGQCDLYPDNHEVEFKDIIVNGKVDHNTKWEIRYPCGSPDCQQKVISSEDGRTVELTWNGADPVPTPSPLPTPGPTPSPGGCHAISEVVTDDWCVQNCAAGYCPADFCAGCGSVLV